MTLATVSGKGFASSATSAMRSPRGLAASRVTFWSSRSEKRTSSRNSVAPGGSSSSRAPCPTSTRPSGSQA